MYATVHFRCLGARELVAKELVARELSRVSFILDLSLFLIIFSLLNDRSPEQFVAIIERAMRSAMSTFGNVC